MKIKALTILVVTCGSSVFWATGQPPVPPLLQISEIMYNSPEDADSLNFIEISSNGSGQLFLSDWEFTSGIDFQFPDSIHPVNTAFLITQDSVAFENVYGIHASQWDGFSNFMLSNPLVLKWQEWFTDSINLETNTPFGPQANGFGHSIERCIIGVDNGLFFPSTNSIGVQINGHSIHASPGVHTWINCPSVDIQERGITSELKLYPNPIIGSFNLSFNPLHENATLRIRNPLGQVILERRLKKGTATFSESINLNAGVYLIELDDGTIHQHEYMVVTE